MKCNEVISSPRTPEQQRIAALKATKDRAADALVAERQRQQVARTQQQLQRARQAASAAQRKAANTPPQ